MPIPKQGNNNRWFWPIELFPIMPHNFNNGSLASRVDDDRRKLRYIAYVIYPMTGILLNDQITVGKVSLCRGEFSDDCRYKEAAT